MLDELGPTEKYLIDEVKASIESCLKNGRELITLLEEASESNLASMMNKESNKSLLISMAPLLKQLSMNLQNHQLGLLILNIATKEKV